MPFSLYDARDGGEHQPDQVNAFDEERIAADRPHDHGGTAFFWDRTSSSARAGSRGRSRTIMGSPSGHFRCRRIACVESPVRASASASCARRRSSKAAAVRVIASDFAFRPASVRKAH